ncbi:MAG: choice-of-anchor J domain-containing protein, partial [Bacteroidia bacterium]
MKKPLLILASIFFLSFSGNAQQFMEGFETNYLNTGWDTINLSGPTTGIVKAWFKSSQFTSPPAAEQGISFYGANYQAEGNNGTVSTWLFAPTVTLNNGDMFQFYTLTLGTGTYPDRLEVRMSTNGSSANAGATPTSVGDFTTVLGVINPSLTASGYPTTWTKYSYVLSGLPAGGISGRFAFRYFVTNSGLNGSNGDAIGLDSV